jgi:flagellar P-ring protein precursor FlgI
VRFLALLCAFCVFLSPGFLEASAFDQPTVRLKDILRIEGVHPQQLVGVGLVTGLASTGDSSKSPTSNMLMTLLSSFGIAASDMPSRNAALVMVTAELPPFSRPGDRVDVSVSSIGDARSLVGGNLFLTPLLGDDEEAYAFAEGPVSVGGFSASGLGSSVSKNHLTAGVVPAGGLVQKPGATPILDEQGFLPLVLNSENADFTTAARVAEVLNKTYTPDTALALDQSRIAVLVPPAYEYRLVDFIADFGALEVNPDSVAKVVVDERSGIVVIGKDVRITPVAVAAGSLQVAIQTEYDVVQPPPLSGGETVVVPESKITATEGQKQMTVLQSGSTIQDLVTALNGLGASPRDVISILQAIKAAGALYGQLEIR